MAGRQTNVIYDWIRRFGSAISTVLSVEHDLYFSGIKLGCVPVK